MARGNSIQGNWAAQARVFGHDAYFVATGMVGKISISAPGSGYSKGDILTSNGLAQEFDAEVTDVDSSGAVTGVLLIPKQSANAAYPYGSGGTGGASVATTVAPAGGIGCSLLMESLDLVNVDHRGASLYVAADLTSLEVIMESDVKLDAGSTYTVDFGGVKGGSFLPILVNRVVAWTSAAGNNQPNEIIALY